MSATQHTTTALQQQADSNLTPVPGVRADVAAPAGQDRTLTFPICLRCLSVNDLLISNGLEDAVARALGRAFGHARRVLPAADVLGGGVVLRPPELVSGKLPPGDEAALLERLGRAIGRAAQAQALPLSAAVEAVSPSAAPAQARSIAPVKHTRTAKPSKKAAGSSPWHVHIEVGFHITPRQFFEIRKKFPPRRQPGQEDPADPLDLYYPLLDKPMRATAWIVEVSREHEFLALNDEVIHRFAVARRPDEYVWAIHGWGRLLALIAEADRDHKVAGRIPEFTARGFTENRPGPAQGEQQTFLRPGAWVFSVFLRLPNLVLGDLVELKPLPTVDLTLSEAGVLFTPEAFTAEVGLDWAAAVREVPGYLVAVAATAFTVRRKVHERALAALFGRYRHDTFGTRLGCVVPFTESALHGLGPTLEPFLGALADPGSPRQQGTIDGYWLPGAAGVNLTPILPGDFGMRVLRQATAAFISGEADEAQRILQLENSLLGAERDQALVRFIIHWRSVNKSALFAFLLDELSGRGAMDAFLNAVRDLRSTYTFLKRTVVALAAGSGWAEDPRVLALARDIEAIVLSLQKFHYDVAAQEIWIDGDPRFAVHAANDSGDDEVGVVGVVKPFYSESSRIQQPRPEILERLREPTRKKVAEIVGRMVCAPGEQLTHEELLQKAMNEAAKEMTPLEEEDLVKVTLRKSVRVLKLEARLEEGVQQIYVHFQPVQKVGDNPWAPAENVIVESPIGFEAYLTYYEVEHLEAALTVFVLAETVVLGGVLIIELGVASAVELFFFVGMQVVIYYFTTDAEDRSLEGYLTAALKGELDAVGFKFLSVGVKSLGGLVVGRLVTGELVSAVGTKWIVFLLRGTAMAAGVGGLELTYQFADDLLHYSHCRGWSNPGQYWDRFKSGFVWTMAFEFAAVPILGPPLRVALEKASTAVEAARALLRSSGKSLPEITEALIKGSDEVEAAIGRAIRHDAGPAIARGFRERVADLLTALRREYQTRAYSALLELYGSELSGDAAKGLQRLLGTAGESQVDALLQRLLEEKASPAGLLNVLGKVDEALIADLMKAGKLAETGLSQRVIALLTHDPEMGARLLRAPFRNAPAELERFLESLEPLTSDAGESVIRALARDKPLPPEVLLGAARQVGALDEPTLTLLQRLHDAEVRVGALFDGSGPSLAEFSDEFAKLSDAQRAAALENAAGRTPAHVLEQAEAQPGPAEAPPPAPTARTLDEIVSDLEGKGFPRDDLRKFIGKGERLSAALARRVERLLDHFTSEEVREFGEFLAKHKVSLNDKTAKLLEKVPRGKLEATITEMEEMRAGGESPDAEWSEEDLAERAGVTISHDEPPPVRGGPLPYAGLPAQEPPAGALEERVEVPPGGPIEAPLLDVVETPGSRILRANLMARPGAVEPPPGYHAHHIIPEKQFGPGLDWMRARLERASSGINEAENGVFLAGSKSTANPELTRLHNSYMHAGPSREYAYTLTLRLADLEGEEFLAEVEKIGKEMEEGEFKILEIPYGWKGKWRAGMIAPVEFGAEPEWINEEEGEEEE